MGFVLCLLSIVLPVIADPIIWQNLFTSIGHWQTSKCCHVNFEADQLPGHDVLSVERDVALQQDSPVILRQASEDHLRRRHLRHYSLAVRKVRDEPPLAADDAHLVTVRKRFCVNLLQVDDGRRDEGEAFENSADLGLTRLQLSCDKIARFALWKIFFLVGQWLWHSWKSGCYLDHWA